MEGLFPPHRRCNVERDHQAPAAGAAGIYLRSHAAGRIRREHARAAWPAAVADPDRALWPDWHEHWRLIMQESLSDMNRELMLDANAVAGVFQEIFGTEMTVAPTECAHCGTEGEIGTLLAFIQAPGI